MTTPNKSVLDANCVIQSSKESNHLYCAICTWKEQSDDWQKHIEDSRHTETLKRFKLTFQRHGSEMILCKSCHEKLPWDALQKHAEWHKIAPWYRPENLSKKFFENHLLVWENTFYCYPCDTCFCGWYAAFVHVSDEKHIRMMETEPRNDEDFSLADADFSYTSLIRNGFGPFGGSLVRCRICDCGGMCLKNVNQHLDGKKHAESKTKIAEILNGRKNRETRDNGDSQSRSQTEESSKKQDNVAVSTDNLKTKVSSTKVSPGRIFPRDYIVKSLNKRLLCIICDLEFLDNSSVDNHLGGQIHAVALKKYGCDDITPLKKGKNRYRCKRCDCILTSCEDLHVHVKGKNHIGSVVALDKREEKMEVPSAPAVPESSSCNLEIVDRMSCDYIVRLDDVFHRCKICDLELAGSKTIAGHRAGKRHVAALQKYGCFFIVHTDGNFYYCNSCNCKISGVANVHLHVRGRSHDGELNKYGRRHIVLMNGDFYCKCCECKVPGQENLFLHVKGRRHAASLDASEDRAIQTNNNNPIEAYAGQTELKALINSLKGQLARLLIDTEVPKAPRTRKPRAKGARRKNPPIVHTSCDVCNAQVANSADLHTHLAQHHSEGFNRLAQVNVDTLEIERSRNSNSESTSASESPEVSKKDQSSDSSDDNGTNDRANPKHSVSSDETVDALSSDDENMSLPRNSETTINNNSERKARLSIESKKRDIEENAEDDIDRIYDAREKLIDIELSMELSLIIDSENIYCLVCQKPVANTLQDYYEHSCTPQHRDYLDDMRSDHALFERVPDQFSALDLARQYMEEKSDDAVRCLICNEETENVENALRQHINDERHETLRNAMCAQARRNFGEIEQRLRCDWYNVKKYWCIPCSAKMESDVTFVKHLESPKHAIAVKKFETAKTRLIYDSCACCALLWYGERSAYAEHCQDPSHKWLKRDGHYLSPGLPKIAVNLLETLDDYIEDKVAYFERVFAQERDKENTLISELERAVRPKFPHVKVYAFGSRISGLGTTDSDIDVFLDCRNQYNGGQMSKNEKLKLMNEVQKCLSDDSQSWDMEEVLPNCRSPLMKVHHITTGLFCDISFENGLSVENTKLIKSFNDAYPLCRRMILFLKQWLKFCDLSGSDRITSYALYWCVIFYLQQETILPSVATLIAMKNKSRTIAGWEVGVTHEFHCNVLGNNFSIREHLVRFFTFYARFDYRYEVACPLLGDVVKKRTFAEVQNLPKEMTRYIAHVKNSADREHFRVDSAMCVQDPFDLQHNIAKAVSKVNVNRFRTFCSKSLDVLCSSDDS